MDFDLLSLIGITSIFIASKHEEVRPLSLDWVAQELGKKKYHKKSILLMERKILEAISFRIPKSTIFEETVIKLKHL